MACVEVYIRIRKTLAGAEAGALRALSSLFHPIDALRAMRLNRFAERVAADAGAPVGLRFRDVRRLCGRARAEGSLRAATLTLEDCYRSRYAPRVAGFFKAFKSAGGGHDRYRTGAWRSPFERALASVPKEELPVPFLLVTGSTLAQARRANADLDDLYVFAVLYDAWRAGALPRSRSRELVMFCASRLREADSLAGPSLPVFERLLDYEPRLVAFGDVLDGLSREAKWKAMNSVIRRHRRIVRKVRKALSRNEPLEPDVLRAAELIGRAIVEMDRFDLDSVDRWILPLLNVSSGRYLSRTLMGRFLCNHLAEATHPALVVSAIESNIAPLAWDDFSNFHEVFSMKSWRILRRRITKPRLLTELDLFVTRNDREAFWTEFCHGFGTAAAHGTAHLDHSGLCEREKAS